MKKTITIPSWNNSALKNLIKPFLKCTGSFILPLSMSFQSNAQETLPDFSISEPRIVYQENQKIYPGKQVSLIYLPVNDAAETSNWGSNAFYLSADAVLDASDVLGETRKVVFGNNPYQGGGVSIPLNTLPGEYYILLAADYKNEIQEANETNNITAIKIIVEQANLDYFISGLSLSNSFPLPGDSIGVSYYIANKRMTQNAVEYEITTNVYLSFDEFLDAKDVLLLEPAISKIDIYTGYSDYLFKSHKFKLNENTSYGKFYVIVTVDQEDKLRETNESNNVAAVPMFVTSPYDFKLDTVALSSDTLRTSKSYSLYSYVTLHGQNVEKIGLSRAFYLSKDKYLDPSDILIKNASGPETATGKPQVISNDISIGDSIPAGDYYLITYLDYTKSFVESNENNNVAFTKFYLRKNDIDIFASSIKINTAQYSTNQTIEVSTTVSNSGKDISGLWYIRFFLSNDQILSNDDKVLGGKPYQYIEGNASYSVIYNFPLTEVIPSSTYYLISYVDYAELSSFGSIPETIETNNIQATAFVPASITAVSLAEKVDGSISAFPNPASDYTAVDLSKAKFTGNISLALYNNLGEIVWSKEFPQNGIAQLKINTSTIVPGVYTLRAGNSQKWLNTKIAIK